MTDDELQILGRLMYGNDAFELNRQIELVGAGGIYWDIRERLGFPAGTLPPSDQWVRQYQITLGKYLVSEPRDR